MTEAEISVSEVQSRRAELFLVDVRELDELQICKLDYDLHIPMGEVPTRIDEIPRDREVVIYCRSGGRSAQVVGYLQAQGFSNVDNMVGGTLAWSKEVDPAMPTY
mgnify:FL=1